MNRYPAGRFFLTSGMAMAVGTAFNVFFAGLVQQRFGDATMLSIQFIGAAILILLTIDVYRRARPRIAISLGVVGWIATFAMLFYFYQHLMP